MSDYGCAVGFRRKSAVALTDNEKVSLWDARGGTFRVLNEQILLNGTWRVSAIGNFLGRGLLGALLIRPLFMKDRSETIPAADVERVIKKQKWGRSVYHIFQARDGGMSEVHVFTADGAQEWKVGEALRAIVPPEKFTEESA
jgi:hypothetical protein